MDTVSLRLDWCSHEAATYAVTHWHYSRRMPVPPLVRIGVWEDGRYVGCVLFSRGAATNLLRPYGLTNIEGCELTRIALTTHRTPVSRIVAVAIRLLTSRNPGLHLIVSYADPAHGHLGAIYQAGGWVYTGTSSPDRAWVNDRTGRQYHSRLVSENGSGYRKQFGVLRRSVPSVGLRKIITPGKHRYLMPLDAAIRAKIAPLSKPYPKRVRSAENGTAVPTAGGGVIPTRTLHP
jgi:hypothetical protein